MKSFCASLHPWIESGIQLQKVRGLNLFKFNDELQTRLKVLIERQKADLLTSTEMAELAGITELDRVFTLMNARIIAQQHNNPTELT